jgi:hypothetical protein
MHMQAEIIRHLWITGTFVYCVYVKAMDAASLIVTNLIANAVPRVTISLALQVCL